MVKMPRTPEKRTICNTQTKSARYGLTGAHPSNVGWKRRDRTFPTPVKLQTHTARIQTSTRTNLLSSCRTESGLGRRVVKQRATRTCTTKVKLIALFERGLI